MTMNPLPPQAYTKDTLMKAYAWLMNQSESVREMATTPDILISLYLKTHRDGESVLERPSIQNFKNELKSLAGLMGELEPKQQAPTMQAQFQQTAQAPAATMQTHFQQTTQHIQTPQTLTPATPSPIQQLVTQAVQSSMAQSFLPQQTSQYSPISTPEPVLAVTSQLDQNSLKMVQDIRMELNLSDDNEALKVLIKIGYNRAKNMISG